MTDKIEIANEDDLRRQALALYAEATRAHLCAAAQEMIEALQSQSVPEPAAPVITGAIEAAVILWDTAMTAAGHTPRASREAFERQARYFFAKHRRLAAEAREATKQ